jgi:MFS transporter, YNFM family, putative membrane transport protein
MKTDRRPPLLFLTGSYALLHIYATQPLLTDIAREYGVLPVQASWTITATTLAIALSAPLAGSRSDRLGRKRLIVPAMFTLAAITLLCAVAPDLTSLLVLRSLQGACIPFVFAVAVAYIDEEWGRLDSARINALYISGSVLGGFCGRFLSGIAASFAGWRAAFAVLAVVGLLLSCAIALWLPKEKNFRPESSLLASLSGMRQHLGNVPLLATCLVGGTLLFAQVASFTYAALHLAAPPF